MYSSQRTVNQFALLFTLVHVPLRVFAASQVQFFNSLDCQQTHVISDYVSSTPSSQDTGCHAAPPGTLALYVNALDQGCTARAFTDSACNTAPKGLALTPGTCYYRSPSDGSSETLPVGGFRIVCGATDADNPVPSGLVSSSASNDFAGATIAPPLPPAEPSSTNWSGSTIAEALGRPTNGSTAESSATETATNTNASTTAGSVTVDPISQHTTLITGTGGRHTNSTGSATWSSPSLSTRTSTSTIVVTGDVSTYTGDGSNNGGASSSGIRPGQGGSAKSKGSVEFALLVIGGIFGLSWTVLW